MVVPGRELPPQSDIPRRADPTTRIWSALRRLPELKRTPFLVSMWVSVLALPLLLLAVRLGSGHFGFISLAYVLIYGPVLAVAGLILAGSSHALPTTLPPSRGLWWLWATYGIWAVGNLVGVGVLYEADGNAHYRSPMSTLLPHTWEDTIVTLGFTFAWAGYVLTLILIARTAFRWRRAAA